MLVRRGLVPSGISVANATMTGCKTLLDDEVVHKRHQLNRESDGARGSNRRRAVFRPAVRFIYHDNNALPARSFGHVPNYYKQPLDSF
jgi:hypothetical protein